MFGQSFYQIVCPDNHVRHYPYSNREDAAFDAKLCDANGCRIYTDICEIEATLPPCPGRGHRALIVIEA